MGDPRLDGQEMAGAQLLDVSFDGESESPAERMDRHRASSRVLIESSASLEGRERDVQVGFFHQCLGVAIAALPGCLAPDEPCFLAKVEAEGTSGEPLRRTFGTGACRSRRVMAF
jgi:hypothetical protein